MPKFIVAAICIAIPGTLTAQGLDAPPVAVAVRSYTHGLSPETLRVVRGAVDEAFSQAGIVVSWLDCGTDSSTPDQVPGDCSQPLRPREVVVRVVAAGKVHAINDQAALGYSLIDRRRASGTLATVYLDRVAALARRGRVETADLLARAIAHEIGHLFLGTNAHASHGLMRAVWSCPELRRNAVADWTFSNEEGETMRAHLSRPEPGATLETLLADAR